MNNVQIIDRLRNALDKLYCQARLTTRSNHTIYLGQEEWSELTHCAQYLMQTSRRLNQEEDGSFEGIKIIKVDMKNHFNIVKDTYHLRQITDYVRIN